MEREYRTRDADKTTWGPGPWDDEADKIQFKDETTGLPCLIKRNRMGALCGYVGVPEGHPAFDQDYNDLNVDVHGGLTYADFCEEGPEESSICHIPDPGESDHVFWFGFDCGHFMDLVPGMVALNKRKYEETGDPIWQQRGFGTDDPYQETYKNVAYVRTEVASLAQQLAAMT